MRIHILPLNVNGAADLDSGDIFISGRLLEDRQEFINTVAHEISHLMIGSNAHDKEFDSLYKNLGGCSRLFTRETGGFADIAMNIGNISGIQGILTDYHLLQSYRRFSQKILGTEGHWEVINEGTSFVEGDKLSAKDQLIRLYPTPKGAFPVVVLYIPVVEHFRSPQARMLVYDMMLAEAKVMLGMARRKIANFPSADGGSISYDGSDLVQEGTKEKEEIIEKAINLGEPLMVHVW